MTIIKIISNSSENKAINIYLKIVRLNKIYDLNILIAVNT